MTVVTLILLKDKFLEILQSEIKIQNNKLLDSDIRIIVLQMYSDLIFSAKRVFEWGNEYHLLAVATFLKLEIYVYTYFDKQLDQNLTPQALSEVFKNKQSTGMHFTYEPLDSEFESSVVNKKIIYGHFDLKRSHYTALIPKEHERFEFKPRYNIFSFYYQ